VSPVSWDFTVTHVSGIDLVFESEVTCRILRILTICMRILANSCLSKLDLRSFVLTPVQLR
jgi:hypothetical protein